MDEAKYFLSAFKHNEHFIIISNAKTEEGIWYLSKPIRCFAIHSNPAEIGNVVLTSLESSQTRLPNSPSPTDLNQLLEFCDKTGKKARCTLKNEQRQHNKPAKSAVASRPARLSHPLADYTHQASSCCRI